MEIRETTLLQAWDRAIRAILAHGRVFVDDAGRECHELTNLSVTLLEPSTAADGVRAMRLCRNWRYPSEEKLANIILNKEAVRVYDYLYGQRVFAYNGVFDQVNGFIIPLLSAKPNTRRAIVSLLDPPRDLRLDAENIVGIVAIHFRVVDAKLRITAIIRTSGFFTGWPANVFQIARLQEYVARAINLPPGEITTISLSAHLHTDRLEDVEAVLGADVVGRQQ
jgi:thymidylate synthase (methanogen type)